MNRVWNESSNWVDDYPVTRTQPVKQVAALPRSKRFHQQNRIGILSIGYTAPCSYPPLRVDLNPLCVYLRLPMLPNFFHEFMRITINVSIRATIRILFASISERERERGREWISSPSSPSLDLITRETRFDISSSLLWNDWNEKE